MTEEPLAVPRRDADKAVRMRSGGNHGARLFRRCSPSDMARVRRLDVENIMGPDEILAVTGCDQQILDAAVDSSGVVLQHDQLWRERRQVATLQDSQLGPLDVDAQQIDLADRVADDLVERQQRNLDLLNGPASRAIRRSSGPHLRAQ